MSVRLAIARARLSERVRLDLGPLGSPLAATGVAAARGLAAMGRTESAFRMLLKLHAAAISDAADHRIVKLVREALALERAGRSTGLGAILDGAISDGVHTFRAGDRPPFRQHYGTARRPLGEREVPDEDPGNAGQARRERQYGSDPAHADNCYIIHQGGLS